MKKVSMMMSIIIPIIFSITLFTTSADGSKQWTSYSNIAIDKEWSITFNQNIDSNSIANNVYLIDSSNLKVAISAKAYGKILKVKPTANLNYNTSYKIVVTNNLLSTKGKAMNQEVIIPFTTMKQVTKDFTTVKTFASEYDLTWNLPTSNYNQFYLIGTNNNVTVGGYETRVGPTVFGMTIGASRDTVKAKYGSPISSIKKKNVNYTQNYFDKYNQEISGTYLIDKHYVTFFYDALNNYKIRSITWVDAAMEMSKPGFFAKPSSELRDDLENLMVELINQSRVAEGLNALTYTPQYNFIARKHSTSMAENNYFSHVGLDGLRGGDRMIIGGITYKWWGENLAYGQYSAIYAHEALMNSPGHRENILRKQFTHVFVGVDFNSKNRPYFTINFYSK